MSDAHLNSLREARDSLLLGLKLSKQGSYHRRAPEPDSLAHFGRASRLLDELLRREPTNREALMMMSQLLESLLDFGGAASLLMRALDVGEPKTKKLLKRLALLQESAKEWRELLLTPDSLRELGEYLKNRGVGPNDRTLNLTREWLTAKGFDNPDQVVAALGRRGGFSDFQVLANVVYG